MREIKLHSRVSVMRRMAANRWIPIIQDGAVVGVRPGAHTTWIKVWNPVSIDGVDINVRPDLAEEFPLESKCLRVVFED